ncbi:MAG: hypothetical protein IJJ28_05195, partial [Lentisphaeria bacterium]|nr:hypothetical protein [Lentisphaeria bacterium]
MEFGKRLRHHFLLMAITVFVAALSTLSAGEIKLSIDGTKNFIVPRGEWREFSFELPADALREGKQIC